MNNLIIRSLGLAVILGSILLTAFLLVWNTQRAQGSVEFQSSGYYSTSTRSMPTGAALTNLTKLRTGSGILGSVVITGAGAGQITLYDATTTNSSLRTKLATTTIVNIPASTAAGTYTFDVVFNDGLIFEYSGTAPTSTITWK
jgi:mannose/fructose/N-acetylgalactosamine-specific phosphotransferase system component IID